MANSCQCMKKTTEYCKVISLQLIKINGKKNKVENPKCKKKKIFSFLKLIRISVYIIYS